MKDQCDVTAMLRRAMGMMKEAGAATGEKADELRTRSLEAIAVAAEKVDDAAYAAKKAACRTDEYVHENAWKVAAFGAAAGFVAGLLLANRRKD